MADFHKVARWSDGNDWVVAVHTPVPLGFNDVGVSYEDAATDQTSKTTSAVPGLDPVAHGLTRPKVLVVETKLHTPRSDLSANVAAEMVRMTAYLTELLKDRTL